jgi:predicted NBD/HSP70 family sugar kinase
VFSQIADGPLPVRVERPVIGLDVGGTKIAGGVMTEGALRRRIVMPTPCEEHQERIVDALCEVVAELRLSHPDVAAIGVGAAGMVEWPQGRIRWAPNNVYKELDLREALAEATGLPVVVDNDANAMAWGEYRLGVGKETPAARRSVSNGRNWRGGRNYPRREDVPREDGHRRRSGPYRC